MYALEVYLPNETHACQIEHIDRAAEVLARISVLLREHPDCEKVVVYLGGTRLFSADCKGNTLPD